MLIFFIFLLGVCFMSFVAFIDNISKKRNKQNRKSVVKIILLFVITLACVLLIWNNTYTHNLMLKQSETTSTKRECNCG